MTENTTQQHHDEHHAHPALAHLHAELESVRRGIAQVVAMDPQQRDRVVAEMRGALPDAAGRASHLAGGTVTLDEIDHFRHLAPMSDRNPTGETDAGENDAAATGPAATGPATTGEVQKLWERVLSDVTEAVCIRR